MERPAHHGYFSHEVAGRNLVADIRSGEVLEASTHSETHISGGGGGGTISTNSVSGVTGHISNVSISSSTYTKTKIWVKTPEGGEKEWIIPGEISVRTGHRVFLYSIFNPTRDEGYKYQFINTTTGNIQSISNPREILKNFYMLENTTYRGHIFFGCLIGAIAAVALGGAGGFPAALFGFSVSFIGAFVLGNMYQNKQEKKNAEAFQEIHKMDEKILELLKNSEAFPTYRAYCLANTSKAA